MINVSRNRHSTLPYGVGSAELTAAKFDMDMKNILRELEDTGFFQQVRNKTIFLNLINAVFLMLFSFKNTTFDNIHNLF